MPVNWRDIGVKCPFYKYLKSNAVICDFEGVHGVRSVKLILFDLDEYMNQFCNCKYKECFIYKELISEKYPEE